LASQAQCVAALTAAATEARVTAIVTGLLADVTVRPCPPSLSHAVCLCVYWWEQTADRAEPVTYLAVLTLGEMGRRRYGHGHSVAHGWAGGCVRG
jgi:hypothetical protein